MALIKLIEKVRLGSVEPYRLEEYQHTRNISKFSTSHTKFIEELEARFNVPRDTRCIDILQPDQRLGKYLLAAVSDGSIRLYDVEDRNITDHKLLSKPLWDSLSALSYFTSIMDYRRAIGGLEWCPHDNKFFAAGCIDGELKVWDVNRLKMVDKVATAGAICALSFSPVTEFQTCAAVGLCDKAKVELYDVRSMDKTIDLVDPRLRDSTFAVNWSPIDSHLLVTAGFYFDVLVWDIRRGKNPLFTIDLEVTGASDPWRIPPVLSAHFVRNGTNLLTFSKKGIKLWNAKNGNPLYVDFGRLPVDSMTPRWIQIGITEKPNPPYVFVPWKKSVQAFNLYNGKMLQSFGQHVKNVNCCAYNGINMELYSASIDGSIRIWKNDNKYADLFDDEIRSLRQRRHQGTGSLPVDYPASLFASYPGSLLDNHSNTLPANHPYLAGHARAIGSFRDVLFRNNPNYPQPHS